ncbi:MAG: NADPH:quinone reductase-like Zn-dependent oxidoreductase, partial [Colwellia sp.]
MTTSKQLFTLISNEGQLEISLKTVDVPQPKAHEVIVRIEAAPINPSDMWPMFGPANLAEGVLSEDKSTFSAP